MAAKSQEFAKLMDQMTIKGTAAKNDKSSRKKETPQQQRKKPKKPQRASTIECSKCNKAFKTARALQQHLSDSPAHATNPWSIHPSLHDEVARLLEEDNLSFRFYKTDGPDGSIKEHDTKIKGRFTCDNSACTANGWSSKKIAITIRMYPNRQYNARVYHQRCQRCEKLGQLTLDDSYAERVAYRLKKWCGVDVDVPYYSGPSKLPHRKDLCEGCKHGHCTEQEI